MKRWWVKRAVDDEEVIGTYFDSEAKAQAVRKALEQEVGRGYKVSPSA